MMKDVLQPQKYCIKSTAILTLLIKHQVCVCVLVRDSESDWRNIFTPENGGEEEVSHCHGPLCTQLSPQQQRRRR